MAKKFNVTGEQHYRITGQLLEIQRQLRTKGGSPIDPDSVKRALQDVIELGCSSEKKKAIGIIPFAIDACNGLETIANANNVFKSGIDPDFKKYVLDNTGKATIETAVQIYEIVESNDFLSQVLEVFGALRGGNTDNLKRLCLTQHQIKMFCEKHLIWFRTDKHVIYFLFWTEHQFCVNHPYCAHPFRVASVIPKHGELYVETFCLQCDSEGYGDNGGASSFLIAGRLILCA